MNKGGFSWKRLIGVTRIKQKISRATGVPLTKSGRQRKLGGMIYGGKGCLVTILLFLGLGLFSIHIIDTAYSQPPQDVDGWSKTKWGMTEAEVSAAFQGQISPNRSDQGPGCGMTQKLEHQTIAGYYFDIIFNYNCDTKKLKGVKIIPANKLYASTAVGAFDHLTEELSVKYGPPTGSDNSKTSAKRRWLFPSTSIEMTLLVVDDQLPVIFMIEYDQREKEDML